MLVFVFIDDFLFYLSHRLLHDPRIYKHIHKKHHEYKTTIGIAAIYAHPIEFLVGNVLPVIIGARIFHAHVITFWLWIAIGQYEITEQHSGYEFPWNPTTLLPFNSGANYHDFHHSRNQGNYASMFTFWDWFFGTNKAYREHITASKTN
jgi:sterol desaturase/sphingolipid hydroxylase (fatty acid hydroxylase superfamily)